MIRNIVVGYDGTRGSDVAVEQAIGLAELGGGRIYLATVTTVTEGDLDGAVGPGEREIADMVMAPAAAGGEDEDGVGGETPLSLDTIHQRCQELNIVCEDERLVGRSPASRLLHRSWLAELLVIGRGSERRPGMIGPNATFLLSELVAPTMVCARRHVEVRNVLVPYKLSVNGTRALSFAGELCETLNARLKVLACHRRRMVAEEAREAAERHLRAYHVESEVSVALALPHEAVHSAALEGESSLIVVPGAHKRYYLFPWQRNETLWRALEVPGVAVIAYP